MITGHYYINSDKIHKIPKNKTYDEIILEFCIKEISWLCLKSKRPGMTLFGKSLECGTINNTILRNIADNFNIDNYYEYIKMHISISKEMFDLTFGLKIGSLHDFSIDSLKFAHLQDNLIEIPSIRKYYNMPSILLDLYGPCIFQEKFTVKIKRNTYENISIANYKYLK